MSLTNNIIILLGIILLNRNNWGWYVVKRYLNKNRAILSKEDGFFHKRKSEAGKPESEKTEKNNPLLQVTKKGWKGRKIKVNTTK